MEPEITAFLKRVALSIFIAFCWLAVNATIGIRFNLAFADDRISLGNILFYIWLLTSFVAMLIFFVRLWRKALKV